MTSADFEALLEAIDYPRDCRRSQERMRQGAGLLGVRSAAAFQQGTIKGSRNVPIDGLRTRLTQLDPVRPYVIYCRNGVQSEAAAFLMRQREFEVVVLRNGLESLRRS